MKARNHLAVRLRTLRAERDLSIEELAEASGLSSSLLGVIERGAGNPTVETMEKIATGLGLELGDLFESGASHLLVGLRDLERRVEALEGVVQP